MKIIYVGSYNAGEILTGPEKVSKRIFEEYAKIDRTLFVQYFQDGRKYSKYKKLFGKEKTNEVNGSEVLMLGIFRMLFHIVKLKPDIIHILSFNRFAAFLYIVKIFLRVKVFYTLNGIIRHENKYYNKESALTVVKNIISENIIIYLSDRVFYLSEFSRRILYIYFKPDRAKLTMVRNGLDNCFIDFTPQENLNKERNSLVFIGNIDQKEKGFEFLIRSLSTLDYKVKLYAIDSSGKAQRFVDFIKPEINIVDKMSPDKMIEFLKSKSIVVAPSEYDTFSISSLEAISCGLYPVLTRQTGLSEFIGSFINVSLVNYNDHNSLGEILNGLINSKVNKYRSFNSKEFSWNMVFNKYYLCYYR